MTPPLAVASTRIDDIPLLIGTLIQMGVPELYDREVKDHGHHEGLSGGWLLTVWLTFILSQGDHAKSHAQEWVARHHEVLEKLIQQPIAERDFNDDRLGSVLKRLSHRQRWEAFETALWEQQVRVYEVEDESSEWVGVWMDSTTASGYHTIEETGLMRCVKLKGVAFWSTVWEGDRVGTSSLSASLRGCYRSRRCGIVGRRCTSAVHISTA